MVRAISGIMLVVYVSVAILIQEMAARDMIDTALEESIQGALDLPTMLVLIVFAGMSARLELFKPKYKIHMKKRPLIDVFIIIAGVVIMASFMLIKYG